MSMNASNFITVGDRKSIVIGLAGHWPSSKLNERPFLRAIRQRAKELET